MTSSGSDDVRNGDGDSRQTIGVDVTDREARLDRARVAIIGAGPGGICMGIKLKEAGWDDFVILERSDGVGGTWRRHVYPGCACDIQSHVYQYSFELNPDWRRPYASQPEILAYLERCADKYGLLPHCRFNTKVTRATWQEARATWALELESGDTLEASIVVSAVGMFNELVWPDIPGLSTFQGTMFHSARWNLDHDMAGETVAVIGSAASAVQFVPEIVKQAAQVYLFQRTANWVLPKPDVPYTPEQLEQFRTNQAARQAIRDEVFSFQETHNVAKADAAARATREALVLEAIDVIRDPAVRDKLRPQHPWGCKRPLLSNDFYPAFNRPNLELVTDSIDFIRDKAVVTRDGVERSVDTLLLATGYETTKYASVIDVVGRTGASLTAAWRDGAQAYLGITTAGFPNFFMLYGPNTNNGSIITMIEFQVAHIVAIIRHMAEENLDWIDVRPERMASYNEEIQRTISGVAHWQAGCNGYYRSPSGRVVTQWPSTMTEYRDRVAVPDPDDFVTRVTQQALD
jgi:cation diffusion facilitator CzcD-associated flavoprotein CzcO